MLRAWYSGSAPNRLRAAAEMLACAGAEQWSSKKNEYMLLFLSKQRGGGRGRFGAVITAGHPLSWLKACSLESAFGEEFLD